MKELPRQQLGELLAATASTAPAPGGGTSSAGVCALAAALVEMAARIELGRPAAGLSDDLPERLSELREHALGLASQELTSYEPVLEAVRLPADYPERGRRLGAALTAASAAPLAIAETAAQVADLGARVAAAAAPSVRGDAEAGVILAEAATAAAARLVEINLAGGAAADRGTDLLSGARDAARRASASRAAALAGSDLA